MKSTNDRERQPESFCEKDVTSLAKFIRSKMDHFWVILQTVWPKGLKTDENLVLILKIRSKFFVDV